jgi:hypothetical protein
MEDCSKAVALLFSRELNRLHHTPIEVLWQAVRSSPVEKSDAKIAYNYSWIESKKKPSRKIRDGFRNLQMHISAALLWLCG